jgi:hypothetical protein
MTDDEIGKLMGLRNRGAALKRQLRQKQATKQPNSLTLLWQKLL